MRAISMAGVDAMALGNHEFDGADAGLVKFMTSSPVLILALRGLDRWSKADLSAAARVFLAKGGKRESDFVRAFDAHGPLRRAVLDLARRTTT